MERISSKLFLSIDTEIIKSIPCKDPDGNLASNHEHCEMNTNVALKNISTMLFDENNDENINVCPDEGALQAMERKFYETLEQKYSPSPCILPQSNYPQPNASFTDHIQNESFPNLEFIRGMEEKTDFLRSIDTNESVVDLQSNKLWLYSERKMDGDLVRRKLDKDEEEDRYGMRLKGQKHVNSGDLSLAVAERQLCTISVLYFKNRDEMFHKVFLLHDEHYAKAALRLREIMQRGTKLRGKKKIFENFVDFKSLLIQCSEAIAINDTQNANKLIMQIREHSSPNGNGEERMADIFAKGLEARLNGTSIQLCQQLMAPEQITANFLSKYHVYLISSPFLMVSKYIAKHTILNALGNASKLHIIHFGVEFGFHWPSLIRALSERKDGPPKFWITAIDTLMPGFSPKEQYEVAGQKLEGYARNLGVPFECRCIEKKWDEICVNDFNIEKDEVLIVSCLRCMETLGDETDALYCPRNQFLNFIMQIRPHVLLQGTLNGSLNGSFFVDCFKQVLHHLSAMFDLLDNTIPKGSKQRWFLENNIWGSVVANVIACEGSQRFVRPETYKQWHVRNLRAGFEQLPLDHAMIRRLKEKVSQVYHKGFFVDDENEWLLLGWKGRVTEALSTWRLRQT